MKAPLGPGSGSTHKKRIVDDDWMTMPDDPCNGELNAGDEGSADQATPKEQEPGVASLKPPASAPKVLGLTEAMAEASLENLPPAAVPTGSSPLQDAGVFRPSESMSVNRQEEVAESELDKDQVELPAPGPQDRKQSPRRLNLAVPPEKTKVSVLRSCAEKGDRLAQFKLAQRYREGRGVDSSMIDAVKWYGKAASQGLPDAQLALAIAYRQGEGVAQDEKEAVAWCARAAQNEEVYVTDGRPYALYLMGQICAHGLGGTQKDLEKAVNWYLKAAELGYEPAQRLMIQAGVID